MGLRSFSSKTASIAGNAVRAFTKAVLHNRPMKALGRTLRGFWEDARDIGAAFTHEEAMSGEQRHIDEMKIVSGTVIAGAGTLEFNPLAMAGGVIPLAEALHDMEKAGHKWRTNHHELSPRPL